MMRVATGPEIAAILDWAAQEGWNPGLDDAAAFQAADPEGFFVAERAGTPVAAISVVNHGPDHAFLGLYLCHPDWRGQGIGYALWRHALDHAGARTVGLDGVAAQQANYARSGFVRTGSTVRLEGRLPGENDPRVRLADAADLEALIALDTAANGHPRRAFVSAWTPATAHRQTLVLGDRPEGFVTIRGCREGVKIGPLIAPDPEAALALTRAALTRLPAERVIIDVPDPASDFARCLTEAGFAATFATARMYRGTPPQPGPGLQAIATMELG